MDHGLPCSSVHGIFQAGILEWVAISFSNDKPRQCIKKQGHHFANKSLYMAFPVVVYRFESCTINKAEHLRIDAFEVWCWRRLLRVPGTARRSSKSILKEISPGISLEGLRLKLKL